MVTTRGATDNDHNIKIADMGKKSVARKASKKKKVVSTGEASVPPSPIHLNKKRHADDLPLKSKKHKGISRTESKRSPPKGSHSQFLKVNSIILLGLTMKFQVLIGLFLGIVLRGMLEVGFTKLAMFLLWQFKVNREDHVHSKIDTHMSYDVISDIKSTLTPGELEKFRQSCFGYFLDIPKIKVQNQIIHCLLLREVEQLNKSELWFEVGGHRLKFGIGEFALVSGLNCQGDNSKYAYSKVENGILDKYFSGLQSVSKQTLQDFFKARRWESEEDGFKIAFMHFLHNFLLASSRTARIPLKDFDVVDSADLNDYPWGIDVFKYTFDSLSKRAVLSPGSLIIEDNIYQYRLQGFPYALVCWFYECCPTVENTFAQLVNKAAIPRILRWQAFIPAKYIDVDRDLFVEIASDEMIFRSIVPTSVKRNALHLGDLFKKIKGNEEGYCPAFHILKDGESTSNTSDLNIVEEKLEILMAVVNSLNARLTLNGDSKTVEIEKQDVSDGLQTRVDKEKKVVLPAEEISKKPSKNGTSIVTEREERDGRESAVPVSADTKATSSRKRDGRESADEEEGAEKIELEDLVCEKAVLEGKDDRGEPCVLVFSEHVDVISPTFEVSRQSEVNLKSPADDTINQIKKNASESIAEFKSKESGPSSSRIIPTQTGCKVRIFPFDANHILFSDATKQDIIHNWLEEGRPKGTKIDNFHPRLSLGVVDIQTKSWFYHLYHVGKPIECSHVDVLFYYLRKKMKYGYAANNRCMSTDNFFDRRIQTLYTAYMKKQDVSLVSSKHTVVVYIKGCVMRCNTKWANVDDVFFPINCVSDLHWISARLNFKERCIYIYNSLRSAQYDRSATEYVTCYSVLLPLFLQATNFYDSRDEIDTTAGAYEGKRITDPDCGVHMFSAAEFFVDGKVMGHDYDVKEHRARYALSLYLYARWKESFSCVSEDEGPFKLKRRSA
ncbi:uncharacterized protein LOC130015254 [Mercurialis annua]|uniref:uncharacterized protein LOC130015254 n=1 Tax=Mercurialis annua TaxID=3986 RepID=UPI0024ADFF4D|nr:uncharacterized protein LOC130015254 [Mercurialis annua]